MNQDATSLERLNDIALPLDVSWWPLAPGWVVVLALLSGLAVYFAAMLMIRFRSNAYRRAALRQLVQTSSVSGIAELLRRTALAVAPRSDIAGKTGDAWLDWLASRCSVNMSDRVRQQLTRGVYGRGAANEDLDEVRSYAKNWIDNHQRIKEET
jgi:hypothetical protein